MVHFFNTVRSYNIIVLNVFLLNLNEQQLIDVSEFF